MNGLNEADQKRADKAYDKWSDENEGKDRYIENWIDKNDIDF